ncbi:MAG: 4Fe-4S dicluster domain-containing protein [Elusimicrobia bacterium]|nr:4Fe-4S dicluster domain-containing protein [Elusimicrobiota bacterium]
MSLGPGLRYLPAVASLKLDIEACTGCGTCVEVCPHAVFDISDRKASIKDLDACMECGACSRNCPARALAVSAGVGCAQAIFNSMLTGGPPDCGCGSDQGSSCCS